MSQIKTKPLVDHPVAPKNVRPLVVIQANRGWAALRTGDLWQHRELLYFLVWRDIKVRYKQTVLGVFWAVIQPLATVIVFSIFFHGLANVPSEGALPYPLFAFAGMLPWQFFSKALSQSAFSMLNSASLIRKVYFPRAIIPIAGVLSSVLDLFFGFLVLLAMLLFYQVWLSAAIIWLPVFLLILLMTVQGLGFWFSALSVRFRDIRYLVPFLLQFWLFATPIVYPSSLLSEPWRTLYGLNPMAGVVDGFRWAVLGVEPSFGMLGVSGIVALALLLSGFVFFRQTERGAADLI